MARSGGVQVTNVESTAGPTISTLGKAVTRGISSNGSSQAEEKFSSRKTSKDHRPSCGTAWTKRKERNVGKTVFCGKAKRSKKEQGEPEAEETMEDDEAPNDDVDVSGLARRQSVRVVEKKRCC